MVEGPAESRKVVVLVVEPDPHVRALERYFLEQAGYSVEFCGDGATALERVRVLQPVFLVSEILVPRMDGLSVCRAIKGDAATRHVIVLIFSILAAEDRAREAGADGFLRKPLNDVTLVQTVQRLLVQHGKKG